MRAGEKQQFIQARFPGRVRKSAFELYSTKSLDTLLEAGGAVIGVFPSFVSEDLAFLDAIEVVVQQMSKRLTVYVLDMASLDDEEQLRAIFPAHQASNQSPVVALWADGAHVWTFVGEKAKACLLDTLKSQQVNRAK